jgi:hypothetical protein
VSPGKEQQRAESKERRGQTTHKAKMLIQEPAHSWARGEGSDSLAGGGGNLSSDPPSAVELLRRTGALAKVDASPGRNRKPHIML